MTSWQHLQPRAWFRALNLERAGEEGWVNIKTFTERYSLSVTELGREGVGEMKQPGLITLEFRDRETDRVTHYIVPYGTAGRPCVSLEKGRLSLSEPQL